MYTNIHNYDVLLTQTFISMLSFTFIDCKPRVICKMKVTAVLFIDKPDPPSGFHAIAELITESTIAVQWLPSFNGGRPQHFVLNYSETGLDWIMRIVPSSGDALYNLTLKGLSGGTLYRLLLYSENVIGRSKLSDVLYIQTKCMLIRQF
jgi:hypothetical protein